MRRSTVIATVVAVGLLAGGALLVVGASSSDPDAGAAPVVESVSVTSTTAPDTTSSTSTSSSTTTTSTTSTSTTTTLPWQAFPSGAVEPIGPKGGSAPTRNHVETTDPVVFLTIDDGRVRDQRVFDFLLEHHIPATLFLNPGYVRRDPAYFAQFLQLGGSVNSHTRNHPKLDELPYGQQQAEICDAADDLEELVGARGRLMRPPFGDWNGDTQNAAASCGLAAVVLWRASANNGQLAVQGADDLHPGDIILCHFRDDLYGNLQMLLDRVKAEGLTFARLEDYFVPTT